MDEDNEFGQFLLVKGYIDAVGLARGLEIAMQSGETIAEVLGRLDLLPKAKLEEAVRDYLGIPEISLTQVIIDPGVAGLIP